PCPGKVHDERLFAQDSSVEAAPRPKHGVRAPQGQQILMERVGLGMEVTFSKIQSAALERLRRVRVGKLGHHFRGGQCWKLTQKVGAPLFDKLSELRVMVREEEKRA